MPYVSDATVNMANHVLSTGSADERYTMLTHHPVLPPSGGIAWRAVNPNAQNFNAVVTQNYSNLKIGGAEDSIAFVKLRANEKNEIGAMTFTVRTPAQLPTVNSRAGWTAVWWLPWQSGHLVKIKIRSNINTPVINCGNGVDPVNNPAVFFTAAINGCSVFGVGDAQNPSMYHGGKDGAVEVRGVNELTEDAWRRLLGRGNTRKNGAALNVQSIGKTDYISEMKPQAEWRNPLAADDSDRTSFETAASRALLDNLQQRGTLNNISVRPFGMVFGLRDAANNWTMTLAKNAFVTYQRIITTKRFGHTLGRSPKIAYQGETRESRVYDPHGNLNYGVDFQGRPKEPIISVYPEIWNCHTLGFQDFFPGHAAAQMYDLNTIAVF